ncbi:endonuclease/exonuclease/phosphatase family protein [Fulvivirgaceae bacterium BMA10]|uniref:Endonuclease/exonuclease/phosphatase family protein n=1 Tax=Splendidivirga corallicola TaxID=3051826 RepID=A0ABT8KHE8_9BACT|nr:endonuclease/exonuclease/phosphatase family protein [Fulvivirgaceae bacterium BMA10]
MSKFFHKAFLILTVIVYLSIFISPGVFWPLGFLSFLIPILVILNLILLGIYIVKRKPMLMYPLIGVITGLPFILVTLVVNRSKSANADFTVLNFNARVFNVYAHLNQDYKSSKDMIKWASNDDADIKCIQEFYNDKNSSIFNTTQRLGDNKDYNYYFKPQFTNKQGAEFGLAIFSKFRIINKGFVKLKGRKNNHAIFVDVIKGIDTLRVYNLHLESMSIDENNIVNAKKLKNTYIDLFHRLKSGIVIRANQVDQLLEHFNNSPYQIIVCGDLNELPYSYTYFTLKSKLNNAFEDGGNGFGFSYNGKLPFLRIDNQFYSDEIEVFNFETLSDVTYSDHFPIKANYRIKRKKQNNSEEN